MTGPGTAASPSHNALGSLQPSLPSEWYYDDAHYRRELERIWGREWTHAGHVSSLAEERSYMTVEIGEQSVVVIRTGRGEIRAFHNTCRHRGSILCTDAEGRLPGDYIVCPYHQWTYETDTGALARISSFTEPEGFDRADHSLFGVAVAVWRGFVFVNLDPRAQWNAESAFQRPPDNFRNFPLEDMVRVESWRTAIECNWKTFWENFNECLHCPAVHPSLTRLVPLFTRRIVNPMDVPDWKEHAGSDDPRYRGGLRAGAQTWSTDGSAQGAQIESLTREDLDRGHCYASSWPSVFIGGYADHVRTVSMRPMGPERTELRVEWLLTAQTAASPDYDRSNIVDFAKTVMEEDARACELNQRGLHAAPMTQGVLMPEEYLVKRFHDWVRGRLGAR